MFTLLVVIIALALIFDYINGFHDAANSIATIVSTKVLTPFQAVIWAAIFNFTAFFIFTDHGVANTIAKTVHEQYITLAVILAGIVAAIFWNLLTWWFGIPSSSSHTLIGGFAGAAIAHAGFESIASGTILKIASFIFLAPIIGMIMAFIISVWFLNSFRKSIWPKMLSLAIIVGVFIGWNSLLDTRTPMHLGAKKYEMAQNGGVLIEDITSGTPIFKMGIRKGDIITHIDQHEIFELKDFNALWDIHQKGDVIKLEVIRDNAPLTIEEKYNPRTNSILINNIIYAKNFKWFLIGVIMIIMSIFSLFLSSLNYAQSERWLKRMQLVSSAIFSIGHGGNDAQKVMGIIMAAFIAYDPGHYSLDHMIWWVPLACYGAIALGTMSGGWKIIKTMGTRITKVTPFEGVAAETAGALTLFLTEMLKIPVSTTHTITGSIIGVGATKRLSAVRWGVTINLLWAWVMTIPISALIAMGVYHIVTLFGMN
jgi:PiT family inorganic phosphate transporter